MSEFGTRCQKLYRKLLGLISPRHKLITSSWRQLRHDQQILTAVSSKKLPSWRQLSYLPRVLSEREKTVIKRLSGLILFCCLSLVLSWYLQKTETVPAAGGDYAEAMIGAPRFINPVLAPSNDVDSDLASLIYSGLLRRDNQKNLQPDLAQRYEVSPDLKTYTFYLRSDATWQDGQAVTADDILFTFSLIQDQQYKSPLYRTFKGVNLEKVDEQTVRFTLKEPFASFLQTLTFGILPQHLWDNISPENFALSEFNLRPVGSGPWRFKNFTKDNSGKIKTYTLVPWEKYYGAKPYLQKIVCKFYGDYAEAIDALKSNSVRGASFIPREERKPLNKYTNIKLYDLPLPQYTAVFFNMKGSALLTDKAVRQALSLAVDKEKIIREVLLGGGNLINSPIPAGFSPYSLTIDSQYSLGDANYLLEKAGWKKQADGTRQKSKQALEITLTVTDKTESIKTGELIQKAWQDIGVKTNLNIVATSKIQREVIRTRAYDALLLGEVLGSDPDPFSFWHSSQVDPPGLNLSGYANRQIDSLIEEARQTNDQAKRIELYQRFQSLLVKDYPAIFLYSPLYTYALKEQIKGFSVDGLVIPADRFNNLSDWYIKRKKKLW